MNHYCWIGDEKSAFGIYGADLKSYGSPNPNNSKI